jgi:hypothetical protein
MEWNVVKIRSVFQGNDHLDPLDITTAPEEQPLPSLGNNGIFGFLSIGIITFMEPERDQFKSSNKMGNMF